MLLERVGFAWMRAGALRSAPDPLYELGRTADAEERAREALALSRQLVDRKGIVYALARLARLAIASVRNGYAGRLWGAVEGDAERRPVGHWELASGEYAAQIVNDSAGFARGRAAGRRLSLDEGVEHALGS